MVINRPLYPKYIQCNEVIYIMKHIKLNLCGLLIGLCIALVIIGLCMCFYSVKAGLILGLAFPLIGSIKLELKNNQIVTVLHILWGIALISLCVVTTQMLNNATFFFSFFQQLINIFCAAIPCLFLYLLTGRWLLSVCIGTGICMILSGANFYVFQFRGNALQFADILSIKTAANVAGQYKFTFPAPFAYGWFFWLLGVFACFNLPNPPRRHIVYGRIIGSVVLFLLISTVQLNESRFFTYMWANEGTNCNGFCLTFYKSIISSAPKKPQHYSLEQIALLESQHNALNAPDPACDSPNVIVIMNESFADLSVLGSTPVTNQPITPFLDALKDNVIRGHALTSAYGGSTANSEFEFLTSLTMGHLPSGSVPYQQYVKNELFTLPYLMQQLGYQCTATHPYLSSGWSRTVTYPLMGLTNYTFLEDYPQEDLIREYVSDREMYDYILNNLEAADSDSPQFIFGITMQNHGGYTYSGDNYTQSIKLEGYSQDYPLAEQYLSLIHESDIAISYLLTELERSQKNTVVLFFGDHLPMVETDFYETLHDGGFDTLAEQQLMYTVPFFIWANYDIPEEVIDLTSLNYLSLHLLEILGFDLPPYYHFLSQLRFAIPAMNRNGFYSRSTGSFLTFEEASGMEAEWLHRYAILQYNNLFDVKNRSDHFFGQHMTG